MIIGLFNIALSNATLMKNSMNEQFGSVHSLFLGTIPAFASRD